MLSSSLRHSLLLSSALNGGYPRHTLRNVQLSIGLDICKGIRGIQSADLDDLDTLEGRAVAPDGGAAVTAGSKYQHIFEPAGSDGCLPKVAGDGVAAIGGLAVLLGGALGDFELCLESVLKFSLDLWIMGVHTVLGPDAVGAVGRAGDLAAVDAVAEGLIKCVSLRN